MQEVEVYPPGTRPDGVQAGDLLFKTGTEPLSRLIRLTTRSKYSHVAIVRGEDEIIHAVQRGVIREKLSKYDEAFYTYVRCPMSGEDRAQVVSWLDWVVGEGWQYGFATFFGMALFWATGGKLMISAGAKAAICSGLSAEALRAANYRFSKTPAFMTPKDLFDDITSGRAIP